MVADGQALLKIGELAKRTDKTVRALHLYEERGLIEPAERTKGGFRQYDAANVARIEYIDRLQLLGLSLNDIRALLQSWSGHETPRAAMGELSARYERRLTEVRHTIRELQRIEGELSAALGFLSGCAGCPKTTTPAEGCRDCARSEQQAAVPLVAGLTGG